MYQASPGKSIERKFFGELKVVSENVDEGLIILIVLEDDALFHAPIENVVISIIDEGGSPARH